MAKDGFMAGSALEELSSKSGSKETAKSRSLMFIHKRRHTGGIPLRSDNTSSAQLGLAEPLLQAESNDRERLLITRKSMV